MIAAMAKNRVIGVDNRLPWRLPADLKHFKRTTLGHAVIMGRKNYESIGRPLPERRNIVVTTTRGYQAPGCIIVHNLDDAIAAAGDDPEIFVIGGARIYEQMLPRAQRLYLTLIEADIRGDTLFPEFDSGQWRELQREAYRADASNPYDYTFVILERG